MTWIVLPSVPQLPVRAICLTVVDKGEGWFAIDASAETVSRTASGLWQSGARLNLERALKVGDELGGHIVTGHVDGVGRIVASDPVGDSWKVDCFERPPRLSPYIAAKGSITVDGISLTVNEIADQSDQTAQFTLNIIPHTAEMTTLDSLFVGREVESGDRCPRPLSQADGRFARPLKGQPTLLFRKFHIADIGP